MDNNLIHTNKSLARDSRMLQHNLNLLQIDNESPLDHLLAGGNKFANILAYYLTTSKSASIAYVLNKPRS